MAFVDVVDGRVEAERAQRADTADAEQQLLADAVLAVAGVQRVRHPRHVEQVQRDRTDVVPPDGRAHGLAGEVHVDGDVLADEAERLRVELLVLLRLPAFVADALREVAAAVEEADADERQAEVGRRLQVVAGEDAETAGVDREAGADAELHAEVRDEHVVAVALLGPPRLVCVVCGCRIQVVSETS